MGGCCECSPLMGLLKLGVYFVLEEVVAMQTLNVHMTPLPYNMTM